MKLEDIKPSDINCHPGVSIVDNPVIEAIAETIMRTRVMQGDTWKPPEPIDIRNTIRSLPDGAVPASVSDVVFYKVILLCWDLNACMRFSEKWKNIAISKTNAMQNSE